MENKLSLGVLSTMLAKRSGKSKKVCDDFLREFFKAVSETLEQGESIRIKGFGSFKIGEVESRVGVSVATGEKHEIPAYKKVIFTPSKELAGAINKPFEEFESVEMDDDVPDEIIYGVEDPEEESMENQEIVDPDDTDENDGEIVEGSEDKVSVPRLEEGSDEEAEDDEITLEAYELPETQETEPETDISQEMTTPTQTITQEPERVPLPVYDYEEPKEKSRFGIGFLVGALSTFAVCAVVFIIGCFLDWWPENLGRLVPPVAQTTEATNPLQDEGVDEMIQEEVKEPVYDTVSTTRFLTTIAREHYGDFNFWPYIYLENQEILGHPDRITPGTKVIVPELSKYGVDPANKEDVKKAKEAGMEIYARFK